MKSICIFLFCLTPLLSEIDLEAFRYDSQNLKEVIVDSEVSKSINPKSPEVTHPPKTDEHSTIANTNDIRYEEAKVPEGGQAIESVDLASEAEDSSGTTKNVSQTKKTQTGVVSKKIDSDVNLFPSQVANVEPQFASVDRKEPIIDETELELKQMSESAHTGVESTTGSLPSSSAIATVEAHNKLNRTESKGAAPTARGTDEIFEVDLTDVTAKKSENIVYKKEEYIHAGSSRNIKVADRLRERLSPQFDNVLIIQERDGCDGDEVYKVIIGPVEDRSARHKIMSILDLKGITGFSKII